MSTQGGRIVQTDALAPNTTKPFPGGANSIYRAGIVTQQNQAQLQTALGQSGGIRKKRNSYMRMRGGNNGVASQAAPLVIVKPLPSYAVDKDASNANNTQIAGLANSAQNSAAFDNTTSQAQVAGIAAQQQSVYSGKGGYRRRRASNKKGGSWPIWGCLSGGKKSRRYKKNCKCKTRKHRKTKHHRRTRK